MSQKVGMFVTWEIVWDFVPGLHRSRIGHNAQPAVALCPESYGTNIDGTTKYVIVGGSKIMKL